MSGAALALALLLGLPPPLGLEDVPAPLLASTATRARGGPPSSPPGVTVVAAPLAFVGPPAPSVPVLFVGPPWPPPSEPVAFVGPPAPPPPFVGPPSPGLPSPAELLPVAASMALAFVGPLLPTLTASTTDTTSVAFGLDALDDGAEEVAEEGADDDEIRLDALDLIGVAPPPEEKANEVVLPVDTQPVVLADIVDPYEQLEIGKSEMLRDAWIDGDAARDLLDDLDALDRAGPPAWPEPGDVTWDIPLSNDERVNMWIKYFQGAGRERFRVWMGRLTRVAPMYWSVLETEGLPRDTIFLSMIESGFSARATSWASAAGPWQFMPDTGRHYGLEVGFWVDERRDYEASTHAAAAYLKRLHNEFGDWMLAWAAYNTGEGRIRRAVKRLGTKDFWTISRSRHLYRETKHYVPKLIAAAMVAKQPEAYGIEPPEYLSPLVWDTVTVTTAVDLETMARACGPHVRLEDLEGLNPALYRGVTPPRRDWSVKVPPGARLSCALGLSSMSPQERLTYRFHRLKKGDSLATLAKQYQTTAAVIAKFNKIEPTRPLDPFEAIVVPLPLALDATIAPVEEDVRWTRNPPFTPLSAGSNARTHRVRSGDTLWKIARKYGVSLQSLRAWNGLGSKARLRVGQSIRLGR